MAVSDSPAVLDEEVTADSGIRTWSVLLDIPLDEFLDAIRERDVHGTEDTRRTGLVSMLIGGEGVAGSFQAYETREEALATDRDRSVEDFFSGSGAHTDDLVAAQPRRTVVVIHPFGGREELAERTGRDYEAEERELVEWLVDVVEDARGGT